MARLVMFWAGMLSLRLVYLQVVQHDLLKRRAGGHIERVAPIYASRGTFYDREGRPLAVSVPSYTVTVNPQKVPNVDTAADVFAEFLELDRAKIREQLQAAKDRHSGHLVIKRWLSPDDARKVRRLREGSSFRWIDLQQEGHRQNPDGTLARAVLGRYDAFERGVSGLELSLDNELAGQQGKAVRHENVLRAAYESETREEPRPGTNFYLTIHRALQYEAERALKELFPTTGALAGTVIVMDPYTGQILALARTGVRRDGVDGNALDLAVSSTYEPGSVFKIFTYASAIDRGKMNRDTLLDCSGGRIEIGKRVIRDTHAHGVLPAWEAFAQSSNVGAIRAGRKMEDDEMWESLRRFGFGQETGLPLPDEQAGSLQPITSLTRHASVSIGYGVTVTAMQLARAGSVVANGGLLVRPQLILARQRVSGQREKLMYPEPVRVIKPETAIALRWMMMQVVEKGTGRRSAQLKTHTTAGKTGTARIWDAATHSYLGRYNGSFVGFAPAMDPKFVIVVSLHKTKEGSGGFGGVAAAPIFREVAAAAMRLFDVAPDVPQEQPEIPAPPVNELPIADLGSESAPGEIRETVDLSSASVPSLLVSPTGQPEGNQQRFFPEDGVPVPDFRGKTLRTVLEMAASRGVEVVPEGQGIARVQFPEAGEPVLPGQRVKVQFRR